MARFWEVVNQVIGDADILLLVLDARMVEETRNREIEEKVGRAGKPLIYVITKSDLAGKEKAEEWKRKLSPSVFVSATRHQGTAKLRERIMIEASKAGLKWRVLRIGVLGYPNVGKSSLINVMKGRKSAPVSPVSGKTRGAMKIRTGPRIMMIDTPGVIPYREKDALKHVLLGIRDHTKVKEPDLLVMRLMDEFPGRIERFYGVRGGRNKERVIESIARKRNLLKKGGVPDTTRACMMILRDWQKGIIK